MSGASNCVQLERRHGSHHSYGVAFEQRSGRNLIGLSEWSKRQILGCVILQPGFLWPRVLRSSNLGPIFFTISVDDPVMEHYSMRVQFGPIPMFHDSIFTAEGSAATERGSFCLLISCSRGRGAGAGSREGVLNIKQANCKLEGGKEGPLSLSQSLWSIGAPLRATC